MMSSDLLTLLIFLASLRPSKPLLINCLSPDPIAFCIDNSISEEVLEHARFTEDTEMICCHLRLSHRCWKEVQFLCKFNPAPTTFLIYKFCNKTEYYNIENCQDGTGEKGINLGWIHKNYSGSQVLETSFLLVLGFFILIISF